MMKESVNVVITGVGSTTAYGVVKGLRIQSEFGVRIVGTDTHSPKGIAGSQFVDSFYPVPPAADEAAYLRELTGIIEREDADLLIPIHDMELGVLARNRAIIEDLTCLILSPTMTILTCNDKWKTFEFCRKNGFATLNTILVTELSHVKEDIEEAGIDYPFMVKPRIGVGSQDIHEIRSERDLGLIERATDPIIQEMSNGQLYTVDLFSDGEQNIAAVPRRQLEARAGVDYMGRTEHDQDLIGLSHRISKILPFKGPVNIQYFKDGGDCRVLEINPRFAASNHLTTMAGINFPLLTLKLASGEALTPITDFTRMSFCRYWEMAFRDEAGTGVPDPGIRPPHH
ncbi:MAG: ATP-grasp domain-containing protein [Methanoregulaceae archaeon]|jgi:carbamoyl-phosphate synthase large subunit